MTRREVLLALLAAASVPALGTAGALVLGRSRLRVEGRADAPGAPLTLTLRQTVPGGARVDLEVLVEDSTEPVFVVRHAIEPHRPLEVLTPYPYDDFVPGHYRVVAALSCVADGESGRPIERIEAGTYSVRRLWYFA